MCVLGVWIKTMAKFVWIIVGKNKSNGRWERVIYSGVRVTKYYQFQEDAREYVFDHLEEILERWSETKIKRTIAFRMKRF